jgi:hypothetical protein
MRRLLFTLSLLSGLLLRYVAQAQTCFTSSNVFVHNITNTSAQLNWTHSYGAGAASFAVAVQALPNGSIQAFSVNAPGNTYTFTGLADNTTYRATLQTYCANGGVAPVQSLTFVTGCPPPLNPYAFEIATTRHGVAWTAPTNPAPQSYDLQYRPTAAQSWTQVSGLTTPFVSLTGLSPNVNYEWQVRSQCSFGPGSFTAGPGFQTVCQRPGLVLQSSGATFLTFQLSTEETTPVTYELGHTRSSEPNNYTTVTGITASTYSLTGLLPNTTYFVRLRATCPVGGQSVYQSNAWTTFACQAPGALSVSNLTGTTAQLGFFRHPNNPTSPVEIRYSLVSPTSFSSVTAISGNSFTLTGLSPGTTYQWGVRSICAAGAESGWNSGSNFTTTSPPPCNPPTLYANGTGTDRYRQVGWATASGEAYNLRYRPVTNPASAWTTLNRVAVAQGAFLITYLSASTNYEWQVQTECTTTGLFSGWTASGTFTTTAQQPCLAPTNARANQLSDRRATLLWNDGGYLNAAQFEGQYRAVGTTTWTPFTATGLYGSSNRLTNLAPSTAFEFQVRAGCSPGHWSTLTAPVTFTTLAPIVCANLTPTGLSNPSITRSNARFSWNDMIPATTTETYNLRYRPVGSTAWTGNVVGWTATTYPPIEVSLTPNTAYEWQVQTVCPEGDTSPWSALRPFTTLLCDNLIEARATVAPEGRVRFDWSLLEGSTTYPTTLQYRTISPSVGSWIQVSTTNGSTLSGFVAGTTYEWQIRNTCSLPASVSDWTSVQSFVAQGCIPPPNTTMIDGVTSGGSASVNLGWRRGFLVLQGQTFNTRWRKVTTPASGWNTANAISDNGFGQYIDGLEANAVYEWQVQTNCLAGGTSAWGTPYFFTTVPNFYQASFQTIAPGDWNDYRIWSAGRVPELSVVGYATPVSVGHLVTVPAGYLGYARRITYLVGGQLRPLGDGRILIGN